MKNEVKLLLSDEELKGFDKDILIPLMTKYNEEIIKSNFYTFALLDTESQQKYFVNKLWEIKQAILEQRLLIKQINYWHLSTWYIKNNEVYQVPYFFKKILCNYKLNERFEYVMSKTCYENASRLIILYGVSLGILVREIPTRQNIV